ncbi:S8 family serine peptidase [bacterium]|nr:S8 family serine peptidase [bacterium]
MSAGVSMNVRLGVFLCFVCSFLLFTSNSAVIAAPPSQDLPPVIPLSPFSAWPSISPPLPTLPMTMNPSNMTSATVTILIELDDEPVARRFAQMQARMTNAEATAQAKAHLHQIEQVQLQLLSVPPLTDADVIYQVQRVFNGVAVRVDGEHVAKIRALPGVRAVYPLPTYTVELARTVPFVEAPALWDALQLAGMDGSSISIGIVDTGIDYLHSAFGGSGVGYLNNDVTRIDDIAAFPSAKVVGGFDFVGDDYGSNSPTGAIPQPDPDPMDCWGHGTHVAGIAAGYGTLLDGSTYTGPYTSNLDFSQFNIGPGIAPRADLYALKVFGCTGSSQVVELAIEWAVDPNQDGDFSDRLDVLNLSLGSSFGAPTDPTVIAIDNAVQTGMIVVAAAGNTGDTYYITAGPGVAARAISVAASSTQALANPQSNLSPVDAVAGFTARGPRRGDSLLKPDISAPGVGIVSAAARSGSGRQTSSGTSMATPHVAGAAALLRQRYPGWTVEEIKARLINTARYDLLTNREYPPVRYSAARTGAGRMDLKWAAEASLLFYNADNSGAVSLSFGTPSILGKTTLLQNARLTNSDDQLHRVYLTYFPALDLPGAEIEILGEAEREVPAWGATTVTVVLRADATELRNVADPTVSLLNNFPRHRLSEESGFVYVWPQPGRFETLLHPTAAMTEPVDALAKWTFDPAARRLQGTISISATTMVTVSGVALRYGSAYNSGPVLHTILADPLASATTVELEAEAVFNAEEMALLAGENIYLSVEIEGLTAAELRGQVTALDPLLRLPVYAAPQPASSMRSGVSILDLKGAPNAVHSVPLVGQGVLQSPTLAGGNFPTETVSIVSALELQFSSPNESSSAGLLDHADLKYVGVAVKPAPTTVEEQRIIFGIATHGEWSTPNEVTFRIFIDTDENGFPDHILSTTNWGIYAGVGNTDEFVTVLDSPGVSSRVTYFVNLVSAAELQTRIFNSNVLLMAVDAGALGLSAANSDFRYIVGAFSRDPENSAAPVDFSPVLSYDVARPGIVGVAAIGDLPIFYALPETLLTFQFDRDNLWRNGSEGLLFLHHHNVDGRRAEVVQLRSQWTIYLPFTAAP